MTQSPRVAITSAQAKRLLEEANKYLHDAGLLAQSGSNVSQAYAIIRILAFEILLKCTLRLYGQYPKNNHHYQKLWCGLPGHVQRAVLDAAVGLRPGYADLSDIKKLLGWYQFIFEKGRYSFELYEDYSDEEYQELSKLWIELGSPVNEADLQFYPMELDSLIHGLQIVIDGRLKDPALVAAVVPPAPAAKYGRVDKRRPIRAIMIHAPDTAVAMSWYARAFPRAERKQIVWPGGEFECLEIDSIQIEFHPADEKVTSGTAGSVVYWATDDFDATLAHMQSLGATLYRGPGVIENNERMCQVRDPWGNCIGLRG